jgi:hypothetical protein
MISNLRDPRDVVSGQATSDGLDDEELPAEQAGDLPERDAMSVIGVGGLEVGLPPPEILDDLPIHVLPVDGLPVERYPIEELPIDRLPDDPLLPVEPPVQTLPIDQPVDVPSIDPPVSGLPGQPSDDDLVVPETPSAETSIKV